MVCRARLTTATAAGLAAEGDGETALRLMDHLDKDLRRYYHDLHNRIAKLMEQAVGASLPERDAGVSRLVSADSLRPVTT